MTATFDLGALHAAVEDRRQRDGLSWAAVARLTGVAASTIRRYEHADDAEADGVLAVSRWLGSAPEDFVVPSDAPAEHLPPPGQGMVRVDLTLVASVDVTGAHDPSRSRTTIQRLVVAAQRADRTIASLTRITEA